MRILHSFLLFSMLFLFLSAVSGGRTVNSDRSWTPIKDIEDPHVKEIAKFAVAQYNKKQGANLTLQKVIKGETQPVAGTNYRLVLAAKDGSTAASTKNYAAVVWEKPWEHFKKLTSFMPFLK